MKKIIHSFPMHKLCIKPLAFTNNTNYMKKTTTQLQFPIASDGNRYPTTQVNNKNTNYGWLKMLPLLLLVLLCGMVNTASATNYYNAVGNVTTGAVTNWQVSTDSSHWSTPAATGSATDITHLGDATSVITMTSTYTFTLSSNFTINGTIHIRGSVTSVTPSSFILTMANGSIYEFNNTTSSVSPVVPATTVASLGASVTAGVNWAPNSTIWINGSFTNTVVFGSTASVLTTTYGNFVYNVPNSQIVSPLLVNSGGIGSLNFAGNFSILCTGAGSNGKLKMSNGGASQVLTVAGNYYIAPTVNNAQWVPTVNAFTLNVGGSVSGILGTGGPTTVNLTGNGTINLTSSALGTFKATAVNISGNYRLASNLAGYTTSPFTTYTVSGTLDCGAFVVSGTSCLFTLSPGGTLKTSLATGVNGAVTVTGTKTFDVAANYEFDGTAASAVTGTNMPATVNNLIANNSTGLTLSNATTLNGTLALADGTFTTTPGLTLANSANVSRLGGSISAAPSFGTSANVAYGQKLTTIAASTIPTSSSLTTNAATSAVSLTTNAASSTSFTVTTNSSTGIGNFVLNFASVPATVFVGQIVSGTNVPSGAAVVSTTSTTVTISAAPTTIIASSTVVTFNGTALSFASVSGVSFGQSVTGTNITPGTIVMAVNSSANTVSLSAAITGAVASGATIAFGSSSLSFASTSGIVVGQTVTGTNIPSGDTVTFVTPTSIGLSTPVTSTGVTSSSSIGFSSKTLYFANTQGVAVGQVVTGTGIPSSTTVAAITPTSVILSNALTASIASGASIYFSTSSALTSGVEMPASTSVLNNLSINNTNGVTLGAAVTVNGILALNSGNLTLGANNLSLNPANAATGSLSTSSHIITNSTGYVTSTAAFSAAYTFPVGYDASNYNPLTITPSSQIPTVLVNTISPILSATVSSKAMWTVGGVTSSATTLAFPWNSTTDITGTFQAGMVLSNLSGGTWSLISSSNTSGSSPSYTTSIAGITISNPSTFGIGPNSTPTLSLTSAIGTNAQSTNTATAITSITYAWGGAATGASVTWTGTSSSNTPPTGITVSTSGSVTISGTATAAGTYGYTVTTVGGTPAVNLTGSITIVATPVVSLSAISSISASNMYNGFTGYQLTNFSLAVTTANTTVTGFSLPITVGGGLVSSDLSNYKLYYTSTFNTSTLLASATSALATTPVVFPSFSQSINSGSTGYFWVTVDVASAATSTHTVAGGTISPSNLTFNATVSSSGLVATGGTQTIVYPTYYNVTNSDISNLSKWGTNTDGSGTNPPNFTNPNVTYNINNGTTNTLGSSTIISGTGTIFNISATSGLTINAATTLTISTATMTIVNGGALTITGILVNSGTVTSSTTAAKFIVNGTYQHNVDGGSVPTATWNAGSILNVTGMISTNVGQMNQNFSNITWNCPNQISNANWTWRNTAISISGNIQILATGASSGSIKTIGLTDGLSTTSNYTIAGNVTISGNSMLSSNASSTAGLILGITINGNLSIGSGSSYSFHAATLAQTNTLNIKGNFTNAGTLTSNNAGDANTLNFTGSGVQTYSNTGVITATLTGTSFIVASSSTLDVGTSTVPANIPFTLSSGATLQTANTGGINGSILTASPALSTTANYVFNGTSTQANGALVITANNN